MAWASGIPSCTWQIPFRLSRNVFVMSSNLKFKLKLRYPVRCNVQNNNAHLQNLALQQAIHAATLRFQESLRPDGMDTRPFRLRWPPMSILFDISFEPVFQIASKKLKEVGAKTSRNCAFYHIPAELSDLQNRIRSMGYRGDRPSIWAMQGLYPITSERFEEILYQISSLAMKGSYFFGELPHAAVEGDPHSEDHYRKWIEKNFKLNGFSVDIISYEKVARDLCENLLNDDSQQLVVDGGRGSSVLFLAKQQRLSNDQLDFVQREIERAEESGDEEGFEDL